VPPALLVVVFGAAILTWVSGCAGSPTGEEREAPSATGEARTLTFAWPEDLEADVEVRKLRSGNNGRSRFERVIEGRYRLRTEPRGDALRVASEGLELTNLDGQRQTKSPADAIDDAAASVLLAPTLLVDRDGTLREVEGIQELRRQVAERIAAKLAPEMADRAEGIAARVLSQEKLSELWSTAVETWIGMEVEPGEAYETEVEEGGYSRPGSLEVSEPIACASGEGDSPCLRLVLETWLNGENGDPSVVSSARELFAELGAALPEDASIRMTEWRDTVELVTEPERLIPHRVRWRREMRFDFDVSGEQFSLSRIDETEHRYRY
jgi:hypothetical protein